MAENPEYYTNKVDLFVALAPAILFKNSKEDFFRAVSEEQMLLNMILRMDLLEFTSEITEDDQFFCLMKPILCDKTN